MIPELGFFALILAFLLALAQSIVPLVGAARRNSALMRSASSLATGQVIFVSFAFVALCWGFLNSDFSVTVVAQHSHTTQPVLYKFAAAWGHHEGSMLLWVLILALFGWCVAAFGNALPLSLKARVLSVQGMIGTAFLGFIIFTSNPFARLSPTPLEGAELNPLLQDPGLAFHPPFLYLGYVGFSMAFSFSVAALIEGQVDAAWARWVRPWVLAAWCFLTIGIALGSWWAYYELGWGGWWYWDPVENASFMPWLVGTALLHSALVVERRQTMVNWTILLGIIAFVLSLVGTFLVRSGVLTSVHAFALDPARGVFILAILIIASLGAFTLYAIRARSLTTGPTFALVSREGALVLNNIFLISAAATVFLGTFYPLLVEVLGDDKISVGPPFFNRTFAPIMVPMLLVMTIGPLLKWRKDQVRAPLSKVKIIGFSSLLGAIIVAIWFHQILSAIGLGLALWLVLGAGLAYITKIRLGTVPLRKSLTLARALPRAAYGLLIAHGAMGICVAGIVSMSSWAKEDISVLSPGQATSINGYDITLVNVARLTGPNYEIERGTIAVTRQNKTVTTLYPERRFYPVRQQMTSEAGIRTHALLNLYVVLGDASEQGWVVRSYYHPLASMIWLGALGMALGGFVSLSDRRFRLGARVKQARGPISTSNPVAAE